MDKEHLDLLKKVEDLTAKLNEFLGSRAKPFTYRYPVVFALIVVVGVTLMSQGIKGLLFEISFLNNSPLIMFLSGMVVLIITGTLYKKLDK